MAKSSAIEKNLNKAKKVKEFASRRAQLKAKIKDSNSSVEDRFEFSIKLSELPRNSSKIRLRNRCELTGRPRGYYRKFKISRIALRELTSQGQIPGMTKSSW
jgi:small subunit ribosomal protein S14|tara:strand:+ start:6439 stop:6744 length:306 start_codon:yes stop_codon:yes gene_type:complete